MGHTRALVGYCKKTKCLRVAPGEYLVKDDPNFDPAANYHICREKHTIKICHVQPPPLLALHLMQGLKLRIKIYLAVQIES